MYITEKEMQEIEHCLFTAEKTYEQIVADVVQSSLQLKFKDQALQARALRNKLENRPDGSLFNLTVEQ